MLFPFDRKSRFKKLLKELQTEIIAETVKFSGDVKAQYYDELNQTVLSLGALGFFVHVLDRISFRRDSDVLREAVFEPTAYELVRLFGNWIGSVDPKLAETAEEETLNHVNLRGSEYGEADSFLGASGWDTSSAVWLAANTIAADVGCPKQGILVMLIQKRLMQGLIELNLPERVRVIETLL